MKVIYLGTEFMDDNPKYVGLMREVFGEQKEIPLYGVFTDEGTLDVMAKAGNNALYIKSGKPTSMTNFATNDEYDISAIAIGNSEYYLGYNSCRVVRNGRIQEQLSIVNCGDDEDPYRGFVTYTQFNPDFDVECSLRFKHRSMLVKEGRERIYPYHLKDADYISVDEETKEHPFDHGFLGKKHKYFAKMNLGCDSYDYDLVAIKEFGLGEFIHKGAYSLLRDSEITRYSRGIYLDRSDCFRCVWPFGYPYKREDIIKIIESYAFSPSVPDELLDVYNGDNALLMRIRRALKDVKVLEDEGKNKGDTVLLHFKP